MDLSLKAKRAPMSKGKPAEHLLSEWPGLSLSTHLSEGQGLPSLLSIGGLRITEQQSSGPKSCLDCLYEHEDSRCLVKTSPSLRLLKAGKKDSAILTISPQPDKIGTRNPPTTNFLEPNPSCSDITDCGGSVGAACQKPQNAFFAVRRPHPRIGLLPLEDRGVVFNSANGQ